MGNITINAERLRLELARRGLTQTELAAEAGVSRPTLSAALQGKPIRVRSLELITCALVDQEPLEGVDQLLAS